MPPQAGSSGTRCRGRRHGAPRKRPNPAPRRAWSRRTGRKTLGDLGRSPTEASTDGGRRTLPAPAGEIRTSCPARGRRRSIKHPGRPTGRSRCRGLGKRSARSSLSCVISLRAATRLDKAFNAMGRCGASSAPRRARLTASRRDAPGGADRCEASRSRAGGQQVRCPAAIE